MGPFCIPSLLNFLGASSNCASREVRAFRFSCAGTAGLVGRRFKQRNSERRPGVLGTYIVVLYENMAYVRYWKSKVFAGCKFLVDGQSCVVCHQHKRRREGAARQLEPGILKCRNGRKKNTNNTRGEQPSAPLTPLSNPLRPPAQVSIVPPYHCWYLINPRCFKFCDLKGPSGTKVHLSTG